MQRTLIVLILTSSILLFGCGPTVPTNEAELNPTASFSDSNPDSEKNSLVIPYGKNIRFEQISLDEGISQSVVNAILQDRQGFLWVGTDDGLNRYDGYQFKIFKPDANDPFGISDRSISSIVEDKNGYLWIGTRAGGLNRYDPVSGKFIHYLYDQADKQSIASNQISALALDDHGLWIGTNNGLDFLDFSTNTFTHYNDSAESSIKLNNNFITELLKDSNGLLWIGTVNS